VTVVSLAMFRSIHIPHVRLRNGALLYLILLLAILAIFEFCKGLTQLYVWRGHTSPRRTPPSVNLVLAGMSDLDYSWTSSLSIPRLEVIPYIADDQTAPFHPPANKGNEAIMYLTYMYEFYDKLPDISIFIHGTDLQWHVEPILNGSTSYALTHLDLNEVLRRQYLNLGLSWQFACPNWINTSITTDSPDFNPNLKSEEPWVKQAFIDNFPNDPVPEILSAPCCSQFAVTKEAIRLLPREQYQNSTDWIMNTHLPDAHSGRMWEHFWQWMFLQKAVDCPEEFKALCRNYHVCFESEADWEEWKKKDGDRRELVASKEAALEGKTEENMPDTRDLNWAIAALEGELSARKQKAMERGRDEETRKQLAGEL
jgi:hypothetical protein